MSSGGDAGLLAGASAASSDETSRTSGSGPAFRPEFRRVLFSRFEELHKPCCPFANLLERTEGRWAEGLTTAKMAGCRWLDPFIVVRIEFLEWAPENRLRHPHFAGIRTDKDAREVVRDGS